MLSCHPQSVPVDSAQHLAIEKSTQTVLGNEFFSRPESMDLLFDFLIEGPTDCEPRAYGQVHSLQALAVHRQLKIRVLRIQRPSLAIVLLKEIELPKVEFADIQLTIGYRSNKLSKGGIIVNRRDDVARIPHKHSKGLISSGLG